MLISFSLDLNDGTFIIMVHSVEVDIHHLKCHQIENHFF